MKHSAKTPHRACGLDFGTSNSTLGVATDGAPALLALDHGSTTVPSAVFFGLDRDHAFVIGRDAVAAYVDGVSGRFMRSLKSILGTGLIDEKTHVFRRRITFQEIVRRYVEALKHRAEATSSTGTRRPTPVPRRRSARSPARPAFARYRSSTSRSPPRSSTSAASRPRRWRWSPTSAAAPRTFRWCGSARSAATATIAPATSSRAAAPGSAVPTTTARWRSPP
jgi:hypothetical protein